MQILPLAIFVRYHQCYCFIFSYIFNNQYKLCVFRSRIIVSIWIWNHQQSATINKNKLSNFRKKKHDFPNISTACMSMSNYSLMEISTIGICVEKYKHSYTFCFDSFHSNATQILSLKIMYRSLHRAGIPFKTAYVMYIPRNCTEQKRKRVQKYNILINHWKRYDNCWNSVKCF